MKCDWVGTCSCCGREAGAGHLCEQMCESVPLGSGSV
jgi:hypothetical protein